MADLITLTPAPIRLTGTTEQPIYTSVNVDQYDEVYLMTQVLSIEGASFPGADVAVITGMQVDTNSGWVTAFTNTLVTVGATGNLVANGAFLSLMRWRVTAFTGMTAMTIWIGGVARRYA